MLVIEAVGNRMENIIPLVPRILDELGNIPPKSLRKVRNQVGSGLRDS